MFGIYIRRLGTVEAKVASSAGVACAKKADGKNSHLNSFFVAVEKSSLFHT